MSADLLDTFNNIRVAAGQDPINPLVAAAMMGAANVRSQGIQKRVATEAAAQPTPEVTIHSDGTATVKRIPVTDIIGNGARDAQTPMDDVQAMITQQFGQMKAAGLVTEADNPYGADLSPGISGFAGGYHGSRELRASPIKALFQGAEVAAGRWTPEELAAQVRQKRIDKLNAVYSADAKPFLAEAQQQRDHATATARLHDESYRRDLNQILHQNVASTFPNEDAYVKSVNDALTNRGYKLQDEDMVRGQYRTEISKKNTAFYNAVNARVNSLKPEDLADYTKETLDQFVGNIDQDLQDQFGRGLPNGRKIALKSSARGMLDDLAKRKAEQDRKDANQERSNRYLALAIERAAKGAGPQKLRPFDVINQSVDGLLSAVDNPSFDQGTVKQALKDREGKITQRLSELDAKMRGNARAHGENMKLVAGPDGTIDPKKAKYDPFVVTRINDAESKGTTWAAEADTLKADLAKLRAARAGAPPPIAQQPAPPKFLKTATNPKTGERIGFDGTKWIPIR